MRLKKEREETTRNASDARLSSEDEKENRKEKHPSAISLLCMKK